MKGISGVGCGAYAHPVNWVFRRNSWAGNSLVMLDSTVAEALHG